MSSGMMKQLPEGLPFERRAEDSDAGWALYLEWIEAPSDVSLSKWCNTLPDGVRGVALVEGAENEWTRRKKAYYHHVAEMASCQTAAKASKAMLRVIGEWETILDHLVDDLKEDSTHFTDAKIERLRVVTEALERIVKSATGNKFITAVMVSNTFNRNPTGPMTLAREWDNGPTVLENEQEIS